MTKKNKVHEFGIVSIAGQRGTGKTSLALELTGAHPKQIAYFNFDTKTLPEAFEKQLGFCKSYMDQLRSHPKRESGAVEEFIKDVENIISGKNDISVCIIDGEEMLFRFLPAYIVNNSVDVRNYWFGSGVGKEGMKQKLGERKVFEPAIIAWLKTKCHTVILTTHSGKMWKNDVKLDRDVPLLSNAMYNASNLIVWMVKELASGHPRAIVLKNTAATRYVEGKGIVNPTIYPDNVSFEAIGGYGKEYTSLAGAFHHYQDSPVGLRTNTELKAFEQLSPEDVEFISPVLTAEEKMRIASRQLAIARAGSESFEMIEYRFKEGMSNPVLIRNDIKKETGIEVPIVEINRVLEILKGAGVDQKAPED